ncbi:MAG: hypothetical protein AAB482_00145 [Patescibacteria group bacterium]
MPTIYVAEVEPGGPYYTSFQRDPTDMPYYAVGKTPDDAIARLKAEHPEATDALIEPE